jgi:putative FmdB family regulatory protein
MPTYSYNCENCDSIFELFFYIKDYQPNPRCSSCNSLKTSRNYSDDLLTINASIKKSDSELKTVGDLANRNRDKLSDDHKAELFEKHNKYKETESDKQLPKGMTRLKKQPKIKWTK